MLGAIAGDIIGSVYEHRPTRNTDFPLFSSGCTFTDDTVLSVAVAECLLTGTGYVDVFHEYAAAYPRAGYGGNFLTWALSRQRDPYNSWGNGSAMRVSPVGFAFDTIDEVLAEAKRSAEVTHDHPEGIRGAQATAAAIFLGRTGHDKPEIRHYIETTFGYDLGRRLNEIRPGYAFDVSCQGSVPESIIAFLESESYEEAVRNAISLGGDADTMACIAGGIAEAFYGGVPDAIAERSLSLLDLRLHSVVRVFATRYRG